MQELNQMIINNVYLDLETFEKKVRQVEIDDRTGKIIDMRVITIVEKKEN